MAASVIPTMVVVNITNPPRNFTNCEMSKMPSNGRIMMEGGVKNQGYFGNFTVARFGSSRAGGGAVLERPSFDQSQFDPFTQVQQGGDIGRVKDRKSTGSGDSYRVLLVDDERHTEKLVAKALPQAVPSVTPDDARKLFSVSRQDGVAVVIVTVKEHAEFYSQMMMQKGLRSSIEPDSNTV